MVSFRESLIALLLISVFTVSLISFGVQLAEDNDVNNTILNNDIINRSFGNITKEINDTIVGSEFQRESWYSDVPVIGDIGLITKSLTGIARLFFMALNCGN